MHIFHKWGKWEEYEQKMRISPGILAPKTQQVFHSIEQWQKRTCEVCGKSQREEVKPS